MSFSLTSIATDLVSDLGYWGLSLGMLLDSFGLPIPSEVLIPLTVVASQSGRFNLWLVVLVATVAQVLGGLASYVIGRKGGVATMQRYGRYVLVSPEDFERAQRTFARYGPWFVGIGRCVPLIRGFVGYPAGASEMPVGSFILWTAAGGAAWSAFLVGLGELWRSDVSAINHTIDKVSYLVLALLVVVVALHVRRAMRHRSEGPVDRASAPQDAEPSDHPAASEATADRPAPDGHHAEPTDRRPSSGQEAGPPPD